AHAKGLRKLLRGSFHHHMPPSGMAVLYGKSVLPRELLDRIDFVRMRAVLLRKLVVGEPHPPPWRRLGEVIEIRKRGAVLSPAQHDRNRKLLLPIHFARHLRGARRPALAALELHVSVRN